MDILLHSETDNPKITSEDGLPENNINILASPPTVSKVKYFRK